MVCELVGLVVRVWGLFAGDGFACGVIVWFWVVGLGSLDLCWCKVCLPWVLELVVLV